MKDAGESGHGAEPVTWGSRGRVSVLHGSRYVADADALIQRQNVDAGALVARRLVVVPSGQNDLAAAAVGLDIASSFGNNDAKLPLAQFIEAHFEGERSGLPAGIAGLAGIRGSDWDNTAGTSHHFHRMTVTVVPLPGFESISNSFINRLLPPNPSPMPWPLV